MWNAPTKEQLSLIPTLYASEHIPAEEKIIHAHFFLGSNDWFIAECDEAGEICFGFAILNGDYRNAEWGYVSLSELKAVSIQGIEVDFDLYWTPAPANQIRTICKAHGWPINQPGRLMANMTA